MQPRSKRVHVIVGAAIGLNLLVGAAAMAGVVPRPVETQEVASVQAAPAVLGVTEPAASAPLPDATVAVETTTPAPTTPPTTEAPKPVATSAPPAPAVTEALAPAPTTAPATQAPAPKSTIAPRLNPTSAQVMAAVGQIRQRIPLLPQNEAYARQFGDAVCTAFDQGFSAAQVQAQVLQAVSQVPLIKVLPADADFAVKTAVQLFCPGYLSKLS
jgi:hypothetical protein